MLEGRLASCPGYPAFLPQRAFLQHGFPLSHPDFGPHNLLVDDGGLEFNADGSMGNIL
jgi:hypothetical protein